MAKVLYTAEARVHGARGDGQGRSADGALEVDLRTPKELGGEGGGTNPEQLFAVGYAACFSSALGTVARREKKDFGAIAIDAAVGLVPTEDRRYTLQVRLDVTLSAITDAGVAAELVRAAHQICPYSNATRNNIDVALTANGQVV